MEELYGKINACSSSSMAQPDDISLFLHQILLRSSSASVPAAPENLSRPYQKPPAPERGGEISSVAESLAVNVSSSPVGLSETENDEYDCDSEEGLEALVESAKTSIPRGSSSKRSRAAEVHNMSEKRRRSRINEKMKALQNLIPNSNKTDKASMLDEAIEYLKQLQLQVQMLAMRNGLSMRPISVPEELLSQMRMDYGEEEKSMHQNAMCTLPLNQEIPATQNPFSLPNQCNSSDRRFPPNMLNTANSDASIGFKPPAIPHLGAYQLQISSENICNRGNGVRNQQATETSTLEFGIGDMAAIGSFHGQPFDPKGNGAAETRMGEGDWSESVLLKAMEQNLIHPSHSNSMRTG